MSKTREPAGTKKPDRRVVRTRRQLRDALVELTLERGWDAVTATDVCERANVGRSTLYTHFADKEDLLFSGFDNLATALERTRSAAPGELAFAHELIAHAQGELRLFRALVAAKATRRVVHHLRAVSFGLMTAELEYLRVPRHQRPLLARYAAGGLVELMIGWLEGAVRGSAGELSTAFVAATLKLLR
jgi:AcrR family transcriptional regulator